MISTSVARAVIGRQHDDRIVEADRRVDLREQAAQQDIQAQHLVHLLVAVRPPLMADAVCCRQTRSRAFGIRILPELVPLHRLEREVERRPRRMNGVRRSST